MKQVLVNLIDNAIKYTAPRLGAAGDAEDAEVSVHLSAAGSHAYLRVADRGAGISKDALPHIFERFYRADFARSRVAGGVGLGLAIVKSIVTAHEGTVSITSTPGRGSTVCVQLPLSKPAGSETIEDHTSDKRADATRGYLTSKFLTVGLAKRG